MESVIQETCKPLPFPQQLLSPRYCTGFKGPDTNPNWGLPGGSHGPGPHFSSAWGLQSLPLQFSGIQVAQGVTWEYRH